MFWIQPSTRQKQHAWEQVNANGGFGHRGEFDGKVHQQYAGILAQTVLADALELPRPVSGEGHDRGIDFTIRGRTVDLKTILLRSPPRRTDANNLYAKQVVFGVDWYLFASCVKSESGRVYVHGLMPGAWAKLPKYFHQKGEARPRRNGTPLILPVDTIEVPTSDLFQVGTLEELVDRVRRAW